MGYPNKIQQYIYKKSHKRYAKRAYVWVSRLYSTLKIGMVYPTIIQLRFPVYS
jgi:hypothetical protein